MPTALLKTRYMTIQLSIDGEVFGGASGTSSTKYIVSNSGVAQDGSSYLDAEVIIQRALGFVNDTATIIIKGMSVSDINSFTRTNLARNLQIYQGNRVVVYAGYNLGGDGLPPVVYQGFTLRSGPDYNVSRDRTLIMTTMQRYNLSQTIVPPINPNGSISLDNLFRTMATQAGSSYSSTGVTGTAYYPIYTGSADQQLKKATSDYGYYYKEFNKVVYVAPIGTPLISDVHLLTYETGMIGYPRIEDFGISVQCYFDPSIQLGQIIKFDSLTLGDFVNNEKWYINSMTHHLTNKKEYWMTELKLNNYFILPGSFT